MTLISVCALSSNHSMTIYKPNIRNWIHSHWNPLYVSSVATQLPSSCYQYSLPLLLSFRTTAHRRSRYFPPIPTPPFHHQPTTLNDNATHRSRYVAVATVYTALQHPCVWQCGCYGSIPITHTVCMSLAYLHTMPTLVSYNLCSCPWNVQMVAHNIDTRDILSREQTRYTRIHTW